jgi:hypothetical protein
VEPDEAETSFGVDEWVLVPSLRRCEQGINCYSSGHITHRTLLQRGHVGVNSCTWVLFGVMELVNSLLPGVHGQMPAFHFMEFGGAFLIAVRS